MNCPNHESLLEWLASSTEERAEGLAAVGEHVQSGCPECARRIRRLDQLARCMGRPLPAPVPPELRRATLALLAAADSRDAAPSPVALGRAALARAREHFARLVLPAPPPALALGLRGDGDSDHRSFDVGPFQVDIALIEQTSVMGQVSAEAPRMAELRGATCLLVAGGAALEAPLGDDGVFRFAQFGPARFALMIDGPGARLVLPDVDLRGAADGAS